MLRAAAHGAARTVGGWLRGRSRWPAQVNSWRPGTSTAGTPVVLVPGSFVPGEFYWHRLAPELLADGHPVFACNLPGLGTREPEILVAALERFLAEVRDATGTDRVVLVGQSFGGVIIRDLLRDTAADVRAAIVISSQSGGLRRAWCRLLRLPVIRPAASVVCPMALHLAPGSAYLTSLDAAPVTDVPTTTIASTLDVFAAASGVALAGADNVVLQELDPSIRSGHLMIGYDPVTVEVIRSAVARSAGELGERSG